ncbi:MAG: hypothetical protein HN453_00690, partial [Gammaproteobacteria bacterium]|nr:hypothetical protein [Gammaproteobacteria bacterium]
MSVELCFAFSSKRAARHAAEAFGGVLYEDVKNRLHHQPFAALLCTNHPDLT